MNDPESDIEQKSSQLSFRVKVGFCVILFGISLIYILGAVFIIPKYEALYQAMLSGKPLPTITAFVIRSRWMQIMISMSMPAIGLALCSLVPTKRIVIALTTLAVVALIQVFVTAIALAQPLGFITYTMTSRH